MRKNKKVTVKQWVRALRSGKYQQAQDALRNDYGYCCLGVLADIKGANWVEAEGEWGDDVVQCEFSSRTEPGSYLKQNVLRKSTQNKLSIMNDSGDNFADIADYIEKHFDLDREL